MAAGCRLLSAVVAGSLWSTVVFAQDPQRPDTLPPQPSVQRPTPSTIVSDSAARADSLLRRRRVVEDSLKSIADSLNPDSLRPVMPILGPPPGPEAVGRRYVFEYDALRWSGAFTLGELLTWVPGVMLVRSGSVGQGEVITYAGQGSAAVELYQDGFPLEPMGPDSAGFDLGRFDIGQLQRIEVEVSPTVLRVNLITDRQSARRARTEASFSTGDASTNAYRIRYLNRWANGTGLSVGASYFGTLGPLTSRGKANTFQLLAKLTWMPSDRTGIEFEINGFDLQREALAPLNGSLPQLVGYETRRTDMFVRGFAATRADGLGLRMDALVGSSSFSDSASLADANVTQASLGLAYRRAHWSAETWARVRDNRNPFDGGARAAWSPLRQLTVSGYARHRSLLGGGRYNEANVAGELRPLPFIAFHGDLRRRVVSDSLFTPADSTERITDWTAGGRIDHRLLMLDVSYGLTGAFTAPGFGIFRDQLPGYVTASNEALVASYQVRPTSWLTFQGWVRVPESDSVPLDPPNHAVNRLILRSQFLPHFRRNAFDAMVQFEMESWSDGVAGVDSSGAFLPLPGKTIVNVHVQFRLVGALLFWTMRNIQREPHSIIPGFELPRSFQRFGIRWEFTN